MMKNKCEEIRNIILEKFSDIHFIEESHQYFIDKKEYTPVSHVIKEYEVYVNWDHKAEEYAKKRNLDVDNVKKDWELNKLKASISGTRTHEFGESYTNLMIGKNDLICEGNRRQYIDKYNTLLPTYPKEEAIVKFYNELNEGDINKLTPIGAEFKLSTKYIEGVRPICGTCDLLFYQEDIIFGEDNGIVIMDWKTNKSLYNMFNRKQGTTMLYPFDNLIDEPLSHYIIQFNLYQKMLESIGIKIVDRVLIWLKNDGSYETIKIPKLNNLQMNKILS